MTQTTCSVKELVRAAREMELHMDSLRRDMRALAAVCEPADAYPCGRVEAGLDRLRLDSTRMKIFLVGASQALVSRKQGGGAVTTALDWPPVPDDLAASPMEDSLSMVEQSFGEIHSLLSQSEAFWQTDSGALCRSRADTCYEDALACCEEMRALRDTCVAAKEAV